MGGTRSTCRRATRALGDHANSELSGYERTVTPPQTIFTVQLIELKAGLSLSLVLLLIGV